MGEENFSVFDIVIDGFISTEKTIHYVQITVPQQLNDTLNLLPINDANIYLTAENVKYEYILSDNDGIYKSKDSICGKIGVLYTINIEYNKKLFTASDTLVEFDKNLTLTVNEIRQTDDFIEFDIIQHCFGYKSPFIWSFIEGYPDSSNNFVIDHVDINNLCNKMIYSHVGNLPQGVFASGFLHTGFSGNANDYLEIVKLSVSDAYYQYLISMLNLTDWSSGLFSTIPANAHTNVSAGGTGFFYATDINRSRLTYNELKYVLDE